MKSAKEVAIVYHSAPRYREVLFRRLCGRRKGVQFTLISGKTSNQETIPLLDARLSELPLHAGGIRWKHVHNIWIGQVLLQPEILLIPFQSRWRSVIFLGNPYYLTTWLSALLCRLMGKRVIMWTHGFRGKPNGRVKRSFLKRIFFKQAHALLLYGRWARDRFLSMGFGAEKLYVAYNGLQDANNLVNQGGVNCEINKETLPAKELNFLWVGRMTKEKKLPFLLESFGKFLERGGVARLILVGDGPERKELERYADEIKLGERVKFEGEVWDKKKLHKIFNEADLAVSPGPIGLFAIHAMAYGVPVLTNDNWDTQGPEVEAVIDGKTGAFFRDGDVNALVSKMLTILKDHKTRAIMFGNCRKLIESKYTVDYQEQVIMSAVNNIPAEER